MPLEIISLARGTAQGVADQLSTVRAEAAARRLAPRYAGDEPEARDASAPRPSSSTCSARATCATSTPRRLAAAAAARPAAHPDRRRRAGGRVELDIKESAQQGMGPHGLVIGATGSGKSELLRTLVLAWR